MHLIDVDTSSASAPLAAGLSVVHRRRVLVHGHTARAAEPPARDAGSTVSS